MNKRQRNLLTKCLLALCLVVSMLVLQAPQAMAETLDEGSSAPVEVSTYTELQAAFAAASDGDVIVITDLITIPASHYISDERKFVTFQRGNENAGIMVAPAGDGSPSLIQQIIFDGNNISSNRSFVEVHSNVNFVDSSFINCVGVSSVNISNGTTNFKGCTFDNNRASLGSHLIINGNGTANLERCTLTNGSATVAGAIYTVNGSNCTISSSVITSNSAVAIGGAIYNRGDMTITGSKIYNNAAGEGGSDIVTFYADASLTLSDSLDDLAELYAEDGLTPKGWFYDFGSEISIRIPSTITTMAETMLKMQFEEPEQPEEPTPEEPDPQPEPDEDEEEEPQPQPEEPTPEPEQEPEPVKPPTSPSRGTSSWGSYTVTAKKEEPAPKAVVLTNGKATLDTTKTEYLLGFSDGLLGSKGTVTRAELAQIVYRLLTPESKADVYSNKNSFKDVAANAWYNEAVSTLLNAGLISMGADGKFNPDENITWGEMVAILAKFAEPNHEWKIITKHWARDALNTAISNRWFEYNDQFNPDGEVTRLEMLNFINTMFAWTTK